MKVTPAHDFNDFEVGLRHDLPMINILEQGRHPEQPRGGRSQAWTGDGWRGKR